MEYQIINAINQMFNSIFPSFTAKQIDCHLKLVEVPIKKKEKIKLLGFIPLKIKKPTGEYNIIDINKREAIRITNKKSQLSSDKFVYYGIDEVNKKIYWKF